MLIRTSRAIAACPKPLHAPITCYFIFCVIICVGVNPLFRRGGQTMLHVVCKYGYQDIVEMLLDADADPNAADGWAQQSAPA